MRGASEVEEMRAFGIFESKRAGERIEHAVGGPLEVAALDAGVIGNADAGQHGDLLAAQARNATGAMQRQTDLVWGQARAARHEKRADVRSGIHETQRRRIRRRAD